MPDSFQNGKDILGTAVCHGDHRAALSSYSVTTSFSQNPHSSESLGSRAPRNFFFHPLPSCRSAKERRLNHLGRDLKHYKQLIGCIVGHRLKEKTKQWIVASGLKLSLPAPDKPEEDYKELGSSDPDRAEISLSNYKAYR